MYDVAIPQPSSAIFINTPLFIREITIATGVHITYFVNTLNSWQSFL